jgi:putative ABC transport system permease protein
VAVASDGTEPDHGPWFEVVGVVEDLAPNETQASMYHPMAPGLIHPVTLSVHVGAPMPDDIAGRLREVTLGIDPGLRVSPFRSTDAVLREFGMVRNTVGLAIMTGLVIVLLFTLAGVNTLMAFTVSQSRREIGIRAALGAQKWRLLAAIYRRGLVPVSTGAAVGWLIALGLDIYLSTDRISYIALSGSAAFMIVLGTLSLIGPARKVTRLEPTSALRDG